MKANKEDANAAILQLTQHGYDAYLAGGAVRDLLLGLEPNDYDVTTSATPAQVQKIFSKTIPVGESFGVIKVICGGNRELDVATFRVDGRYSDNRRPDSVKFSSSAEEDVKRRDFTINAMLMDVNGIVIDYVGGQQDLKNRVLRTVGYPVDRFSEDALRMMRAIRLAVRFNLSIEKETWGAIKHIVNSISAISKERITEELIKTFSYGNCDRAYYLLQTSGLLNIVVGHSAYGGSCWSIMHALSDIEAGRPFILPLAILLGYGNHPQVWGNRLTLTNEQKSSVQSLLDHHNDLVSKFPRAAVHDKRRMANWNDLDLVHQLRNCYSTASISTYPLAMIMEIDNFRRLGFPEPLVNGADLIEMGFVAGPIFTEVLTRIQNEQLDDFLVSKDKVKGFILNEFPNIPRIIDGKVVDLMAPARVVATCKKCKAVMSFVTAFNVRGIMKAVETGGRADIKDPIGIYVDYGVYVRCSNCSTNRAKKGFVRMKTD